MEYWGRGGNPPLIPIIPASAEFIWEIELLPDGSKIKLRSGQLRRFVVPVQTELSPPPPPSPCNQQL